MERREAVRCLSDQVFFRHRDSKQQIFEGISFRRLVQMLVAPSFQYPALVFILSPACSMQ
jgi:hypothetical protein